MLKENNSERESTLFGLCWIHADRMKSKAKEKSSGELEQKEIRRRSECKSV